MPQIAIGSTVVPIQNPINGPGINGVNQGTKPIYVGPDASVNASTASQTLQQGDVLNWPANQSLYLVCDPGAVSIFQYSNNGATLVKGTVNTNIISGAVSIAGNVTLAGPVALAAGSSVNINGTVPIAGNVGISGNVNLAAGTTVNANVSGNVVVSNSTLNIAGNVASSAIPTLLYTAAPLVIPAGGTGVFPAALAQKIDVTQYTSAYLALSVYLKNPGLSTDYSGTPAAIYTGNFIQLMVEEMNFGTLGLETSPETWSPEWWIDRNAFTNGSPDGSMTIQVPVKAAAVQGFLSAVIAAGHAYPLYDIWIVLNVYGTHDSIAQPIYRSGSYNLNKLLALKGVAGFVSTGAATDTFYIATSSGALQSEVFISGGTAGSYQLIAYSQGLAYEMIQTQPSGTPFQQSSYQTILPLLPCAVLLQQKTSTGVFVRLFQSPL